MSDLRTDAEAALRAGDPAAALKQLTAAVKAKPADAKLRIFLAQLLCVVGQWERAHTQLNVVADMLLHRFGLFFYRAWARTQPVVALDRPDDAPIIRHVGALFGLIEPAIRNRDALGDFPKLFFAGRLARSVRDADGLEAWLTLQFGGPVHAPPARGGRHLLLLPA